MNRQIQEDLQRRALELMNDAAENGFVVNLNMHTARQKDAFGSTDSLVVAPYSGKGKTLLFPEPTTTGQRYGG